MLASSLRVDKSWYTNRLEIVVEQHELCCGEVGFTLHSKLVAPMGNLGSLDFLHDCAVEEKTFVA